MLLLKFCYIFIIRGKSKIHFIVAEAAYIMV